jgi:hypothetical protein
MDRTTALRRAAPAPARIAPLARVPWAGPGPRTRLIAVPVMNRAGRQAQLEQLAASVCDTGAPGPFAVSVLIAALADDGLSGSARACGWHDYITARRRLDDILEGSPGWAGIMTAAEASAAVSAAAARLLDGIPAP